MRASAISGIVLVLVGALLLYLLRHLLVQVVLVLVGVVGLILAFVLIVVGLVLISGRFRVWGTTKRYLFLDSLWGAVLLRDR